MRGQQPKDHFCPSTRRVGWEGNSTFVLSDPSLPVLGLILFASQQGEDLDQGRPWRKQIPAGALVWMELCWSGWEEEVPAWGAEQGELRSCSVAPASSSFGPAHFLAKEPTTGRDTTQRNVPLQSGSILVMSQGHRENRGLNT